MDDKGKDKSEVHGKCRHVVQCSVNEKTELLHIILAFHRNIVQAYRTFKMDLSPDAAKLNPALKYALGYHCSGINALDDLKEKLKVKVCLTFNLIVLNHSCSLLDLFTKETKCVF